MSAKQGVEIVPVIDVMGGIVVAARGGDRATYRPIVTALAVDASPAAVARGLLDRTGATKLYVADLDGITTGRPDLGTLRELTHALPGVEIWVDNGASSPREVEAVLKLGNIRPVVGTETLHTLDDWRAIRAAAGSRAVLSLDFRGDVMLGPAAVLDAAEDWPVDVVAMTLAAVGADAGPDFERVVALRRLAPAARIYAAGGVRGASDLALLARSGAHGVLVASAIHAGRIP
ncbi:MAG: HisA/HisF-related TIM barrel protein [Hyphomicrobiaceae bacterium]